MIKEKCELGRKIKRFDGDLGTESLVGRLCLYSAIVENAYMELGIKNYTAEDCFNKAFELVKKDWSGEADIDLDIDIIDYRCGCGTCLPPGDDVIPL